MDLKKERKPGELLTEGEKDFLLSTIQELYTLAHLTGEIKGFFPGAKHALEDKTCEELAVLLPYPLEHIQAIDACKDADVVAQVLGLNENIDRLESMLRWFHIVTGIRHYWNGSNRLLFFSPSRPGHLLLEYSCSFRYPEPIPVGG